MRTWRLELDCDLHAPWFARHALRSWLHLVTCSDETKLDITILVSELITDAVLADGQRVSLTVTFDDGRVRIDVHATGAAPRPASTGDDTVSSRIADAVTDTWARTSQHGVAHTWAELLC